jgi:hypothetical protein
MYWEHSVGHLMVFRIFYVVIPEIYKNMFKNWFSELFTNY